MKDEVLHQISPPLFEKKARHIVAVLTPKCPAHKIVTLMRDLREDYVEVLRTVFRTHDGIFVCVDPIDDAHKQMIIGDIQSIDPLAEIRVEEIEQCDGNHSHFVRA